MPALKEKAITLLGSFTVVSLQAASGVETLFTVPVGKVARVTTVVIRDISATLAGGTSFAFTGFVSGVNLSAITAATTTKYAIIAPAFAAECTELASSAAFQITKTTGSTGAATAVFDVFGYLTN